jgi:signal transduction histidine kinase
VVAIGRKECDRLIRLINDLLDIDKMEAGMLKLSLTEVTTQELADIGVEAVKGMAQEYGVRIVKSVDWQGVIVCDQDRMIEVLTNLLSNAIKYSPEQGTVKLKVTKGESSMIRFSVTDSGAGIAKEQMHKLFRKFQQLDGRKKGGTGLGLAIAKAIIEQHNGNIGVESEPGKGSTFWAELPMLPQDTFAPMPQKSSAAAGRTDSG